MSAGGKCAVFDLDGTLAETAPDLVGAANELLAAKGVPPMPVSAARETAGYGAKALIRKGHALAGIDVAAPDVDALYAPFLEVYARRIADESYLFDGVPETLDALRADGWILSVCTNKPEALALMLLERLGVLPLFGALIGADTLPVRKPDPRPLFAAAERAGGDPKRSVMIGDTDTDLKTARAAKVPCILTSFGYSPVPVESFAPDDVIGHFAELPERLGRYL